MTNNPKWAHLEEYLQSDESQSNSRSRNRILVLVIVLVLMRILVLVFMLVLVLILVLVITLWHGYERRSAWSGGRYSLLFPVKTKTDLQLQPGKHSVQGQKALTVLPCQTARPIRSAQLAQTRGGLTTGKAGNHRRSA